MKCIEFEPAKRRTLSAYEHDLLAVEESVLDEVTTVRGTPKSEEILAGQNVRDGEVIPFRVAENVRTASTMIPPRVTFTAGSAEELIEVLKEKMLSEPSSFTLLQLPLR